MFFGTTPQIVAQFIKKEIESIKPKRVFVPFAGNFVIEQITGIVDKNIEVHSTDVMLYSRAIGHALTDTKIDCELKPHILELFPSFKDKNTPVEKCALVIFFTEYSKNMNKNHIPYYKALNSHGIKQAEKYFEKIVKKIESFKSNIGKMTFYGSDACVVLPKVQESDLVFYDPPVIIGDYEKQYKALQDVFDFNDPDYTIITEELKLQQLQEMHDKGAIVYYRTNNPNPDVKSPFELIYSYQYKHSGVYCIYSNTNTVKWVGSWSPIKEQIPKYQLIDKNDVITENSEVVFLPVSSKIANHYRLLWVKKAAMTDSGHAFLIFIDGKMAGVAVIADSLKFGTEWAVIYSDPACPHSRYKRLSKLVLYLICTKQTLKLINDKSIWEHTGFTTRVFTNEPVSMKYRSLFNLTERAEDLDGNYKYKLIYKSKKIFDSYKDALKEWLKKDGKVLE